MSTPTGLVRTPSFYLWVIAAAALVAGCGDNLARCPAPAAECSGGCADLSTSPDHCGGCDVTCPQRDNATRVCSGGACGFECVPGFSDCDGEPDNGCERASAVCEELMCADAVDGDGDGLIDCNDDDCAAESICVRCPNGDLGDETGGALATGTTIGRGDDYPSTPGCGAADSSGDDDAFLWRAPAGGCYDIDTIGSSFDTVLRVYDSCDGSELSCDDSSGAGAQSLLRQQMTAGEQVVVVVDGAAEDSAGDYALNIHYSAAECVESDCTDGMDTDNDGVADCADDDCAYDPACYESMCADGVDNDGDDLVDCADPDCDPAPGCFEANCGDGVDDEGDGLVDCSDSDCALDPLCYESSCTDGIDSDSDGATDCEDPDCDTDPSCAETHCTDGVDNEGDGATDCADSECFGDAACAGVCPSGDLGAATGDGLIAGPSAGTGDDFPSTPGCGSATSSGDDVALAWRAPQSGCYAFATDRSSYDTVLRIYDACGGSELVCDDDSGAGTRSLIRRDISAGEEVVVVVDGHGSYSSGDYVLDINAAGAQCTETRCADGADDDGDGAVDCGDADCALDPACREADCTDGADNDSDGATDCGDSDCFADAACAGMCPNQDLGEATGDGLVTGANAGTGDDFPSTEDCGSVTSSGEDVAFLWRAPTAGCYRFDTESSDYDTVLRLHESCTGDELECDDDDGLGVRSVVWRELSAGEQVVVIVDGYSSATGSYGQYVLDIHRDGASCTQ